MNTRNELFVRALRGVGQVYFLIGKYQDAIYNFKKLYKNSGGSKLFAAQAKRHIASVFEKMCRYDESLNLLDEIEDILDGILEEEKIEIADIYTLRGLIYRIQGRFKEAICACKKGIEMVERLKVTEIKRRENKIRIKQIMANIYNNLGVLYYLKNDYNKAIEIYQKCLKISKKINDRQGIGQASNNLANIYSEIGDNDNAISLYKKSLRVFEAIGYKQAIGQASGNLGISYCDIGDYNRAIECHRKHLQVSEEIGYKQGEGVANCNLGIVNCEKGDYDNAIRHYQKSLEILTKIGHKYGIGLSNLHLGDVYMDKGAYNKAFQFYNNYLKTAQEIQDLYGIGLANLNLGFVLLKKIETVKKISLVIKRNQKHFNKILKKIENYLKISEKNFNKIKDRKELTRVYLGLAQLQQIKQNSREKGARMSTSAKVKGKRFISNILKKYADKILKIADEFESQETKADCYFAYGKIYLLMLSQLAQSTFFNASRVLITKSDIRFIMVKMEKAIAIYIKLNRKKKLADCYWEYAKILRLIGSASPKIVAKYINKSIAIYKGLNLYHRVREIKKGQMEKDLWI